MFSKIKGRAVDSNEDLQYLSKRYLVEKIGLNDDELHLLARKLMG
jgi:hypothetical protein